jgi:hypothetical protein
MPRTYTNPELTDEYREQCYKRQQCPHCGAHNCINVVVDRKKISQYPHEITRYSCNVCRCAGTFSKRVE